MPLRLCKAEILQNNGKFQTLLHVRNVRCYYPLKIFPFNSYSTFKNETIKSNSKVKNEVFRDPVGSPQSNITEKIGMIDVSAHRPISSFRNSIIIFKDTIRNSIIITKLREQPLVKRIRNTNFQDIIQRVLVRVSRFLNEITGYSAVEKMKEQVAQQENDFKATRKRQAEAKIAYEKAIDARSNTQREINGILQRKTQWSGDDVARITQLYKDEHENMQKEISAKEEFTKCERQVEQEFTDLSKSMMVRYHEEQLWSDKIRSASNILASSIVIFNVIFFLGMQTFVESRRRKKLVDRFESLLIKQTQERDEKLDNGIIQPSTKNFEILNKKMDNLLQISTTGLHDNLSMVEGSTKLKSFMDDFEKPLDDNQRTKKPIELTRDEFDNIILISTLLGASIGLLIGVMANEIFNR
ncbi:7406_t:CDS:2 [Diversispora eburnea]|uniref:Sensitive to high expression protein 9, mitochondrial n=1 Tax=Diversispora eburnea TaxID=1213867 RepID=A0A9N8YS87_9GLOM|nr:7406_t:CDS:2 [Diversispora eburnea]